MARQEAADMQVALAAAPAVRVQTNREWRSVQPLVLDFTGTCGQTKSKKDDEWSDNWKADRSRPRPQDAIGRFVVVQGAKMRSEVQLESRVVGGLVAGDCVIVCAAALSIQTGQLRVKQPIPLNLDSSLGALLPTHQVAACMQHHAWPVASGRPRS